MLASADFLAEEEAEKQAEELVKAFKKENPGVEK
jgi:hypothetical protein